MPDIVHPGQLQFFFIDHRLDRPLPCAGSVSTIYYAKIDEGRVSNNSLFLLSFFIFIPQFF